MKNCAADFYVLIHRGMTCCEKLLKKPVLPNALAELRSRIETEAEALVTRLVTKGTFDVATELSPYLPVSIVSDLVGLPEDGRERMLAWAPANFDCFGPINDRTTAAFPIVGEMVNYAFTQCVPGKLKPGGWTQMIWDAANRGEIDASICPFLMNDYMGPSLDTTILQPPMPFGYLPNSRNNGTCCVRTRLSSPPQLTRLCGWKAQFRRSHVTWRKTTQLTASICQKVRVPSSHMAQPIEMNANGAMQTTSTFCGRDQPNISPLVLVNINALETISHDWKSAPF
jgi:hypothetical protein